MNEREPPNIQRAKERLVNAIDALIENLGNLSQREVSGQCRRIDFLADEVERLARGQD